MSNSSDDNKLQTAIDLFKRTNRMHMKVFQKYMDTLEIGRSQQRILRFLWHKEVGVSQKEIAANFEVSTAAVAVALKKLELLGYIARSADEHDSRYNIVTITEKGTETVDRTREAFWHIDSAMLERLTDEELEVFSGCLEKMHADLKKMYE